MDEGPITAQQIRTWTRTDAQLSRVFRFVESGIWPENPPPELWPFCSRAGELGIQDGCLMWGNRVLVPQEGRHPLLQCLHQGHQGASRMKALARGIFWWPKLDSDIEQLADQCRNYRELRRAPAPYPLQPWA